MSLSKPVQRAVERHRARAASLDAATPELTARLVDRLGQDAADHATALLTALRTRATEAVAGAEASDTEHNRELGEDQAARAAVGSAADALYDLLVRFKREATAAYGGEALERMRLDAATPRTFDALRAQGGLAAEWLGSDATAFPAPLSPFATPPTKADFLAQIGPAHRALVDALEARETDAGESETTMLARRTAIAEADAAEGALYYVAYGLLRAAGLDEEARRLR